MRLRFQSIFFVIGLMSVNLLIFAGVCRAEKSLQIFEKERKIVLTGEISKALGTYDEHLKGAVEYLICGRGGKEYESIVVVNSPAKEIVEAMGELGVKPGEPPSYDDKQDKDISPTGPRVLLFVEWTQDGKTHQVRGEDLLYNVRTQQPMQHVAWIYSGSRLIPDLESEDENAMIPQAFTANDIVALNHLDGSAVFQNPLPEAAVENTYKKNDALMPPLGTPVKVTIEVGQKMQYHIIISGKVQGVGFRYFAQQSAKMLGLKGYAKNLPDGAVEVVAEGDEAALMAFVDILRQGPEQSRVEEVKINKRSHTGKYANFEIEF
jgi:acylphosphatase